MWRDNYIAVDWGTTNRRAWLVDSEGRVSAEFADALGLMSVPPNGFESAVAPVQGREKGESAPIPVHAAAHIAGVVAEIAARGRTERRPRPPVSSQPHAAD